MLNIPQRCNNPLNLMIPKPVGEATEVFNLNEKTGLGFAVFPTPMAGWRAAFRQIRADQRRGLTLRQFIFKFAPPVENDTNAYLEFVAKEMAVDKDTLISSLSRYALAGVMAEFEGYFAEEEAL